MKKRLAVLLGVLVLSSVSFAAPKTAPARGAAIENSLSNLENQLDRLQQMEEAKYKEQEALAQNAAQKLEERQRLKATLEDRIAKIENSSGSKFFKGEYGGLVKEYKTLIKALDEEIKSLSKAVENYEAVESLKGGN